MNNQPQTFEEWKRQQVGIHWQQGDGSHDAHELAAWDAGVASQQAIIGAARQVNKLIANQAREAQAEVERLKELLAETEYQAWGTHSSQAPKEKS